MADAVVVCQLCIVIFVVVGCIAAEDVILQQVEIVDIGCIGLSIGLEDIEIRRLEWCWYMANLQKHGLGRVVLRRGCLVDCKAADHCMGCILVLVMQDQGS